MRFLVFADLHLDQHVAHLDAEQLARRRADLWACLDRLLALADTHGVDVILSAGDLYDQRHAQAGTARRLAERLGQAGCPVFLAPGDEDPHAPDSVYATTPWPANVHVFDCDLLVPVELADGFRLWGAAHRSRGGTPGFLDGFRIDDDAVNLAVFHGAEVAAGSRDMVPAAAPFRAEQIAAAGLTHAFVGAGGTAVDGPWHTVPGVTASLDPAGAGRLAAVIVDVAPDGTIRRQRFDVASAPVHDITVDITDAATTDEVLERMLGSVEDLQGTARVHLQGHPAPGVVVLDEELRSWSTARLEIVLERPSQEAPPQGVVEPAPPVAPPEITPIARDPDPAGPDLGGLDLDTLPGHLEALRSRPAAVDPDLTAEVSRLEAATRARESRWRAAARWVAALVVVSSGVGLVVVGDTLLERGVAVAAILMVALLTLAPRRGGSADPNALAEARARVSTAMLECMEANAELARARHEAVAALHGAGLPTDPDALAALIDAARMRGTSSAPADVALSEVGHQ